MTSSNIPKIFIEKACSIMELLMEDFGINEIQAAGILGNIGTECAGFTKLHEIGQPKGVGGYGWCQWTASRRVDFFKFCEQNGFFNHGIDGDEWQTDAANYGFLRHELKTSEKKTIIALKKQKTLKDAVISFERTYERAGVPNIKDRIRWANIALDLFNQKVIK